MPRVHERVRDLPLNRDRYTRLGVGVLLALAATELPLAFASGSYVPRTWLPSALIVAAVAVVLLAMGPRIRCGRVQLLLLGALAGQVVWTVASVVWAASRANAWEEAQRSLLYLVAAGLAFWAVRLAGDHGLRVLTTTMLLAITAVAAVATYRPASAADPLALFSGLRLQYPITYHNGLASLLMVGFWLAVGLSSGRLRSWWQQAVLMALAVGLVELAVLPQSRGAFWAFFFVVPLLVVLSPNRFRALANLAVVCGAVALAWPALIGVHAVGGAAADLAGGPGASSGPTVLQQAIRHALDAVLLSMGAAAVYGAVFALAERRVSPLSPRLVRALTAALLVAAVGTSGWGLVHLSREQGGPVQFARSAWTQVVSDQGPRGTGGSRFAEVGLSGRLSQWRLSWQAFREHPVLGLGAQNYEIYHMEHRTTDLAVRQPHSQPMQLLAELGAVGLALWLVFLVGVTGRAAALRFRAASGRDQTAIAAALLAVGSWTVHSSADWMWQLGGVTWPAIVLLGGLLGVDYRTRRGAAPDAETRPGRRRRKGRGAPEGAVARWLLVAAASALFLMAGATFLSLRFTDAAGRNAGSPSAPSAHLRTAEMLNPFSPLPAMSAAATYRGAATAAAVGGGAGRAWAVLDNLALATAWWEEAITREPESWVVHYQAGLALRDYRDASVAAGILTVPREGGAGPAAEAAVEAWEGLVAPEAAVPPYLPGDAPESPVVSSEDQAHIELLRSLTYEALTEQVRRELEEAARLNPRDARVRLALENL